MTKYLFLFIFLCINVSIINCSDKKHIEVEKNKINIIERKNIPTDFDVKGSGKISDTKFKNQLLRYIYAEENDDFKTMYSLLSKDKRDSYKKIHPEVVDAETYDKVKKTYSDLGGIKYQEIVSFMILNKNKYQVNVKYNCVSEGDYMWIKDKYNFVKEDDEWKFGGFDLNFRESAVIIQ